MTGVIKDEADDNDDDDDDDNAVDEAAVDRGGVLGTTFIDVVIASIPGALVDFSDFFGVVVVVAAFFETLLLPLLPLPPPPPPPPPLQVSLWASSSTRNDLGRRVRSCSVRSRLPQSSESIIEETAAAFALTFMFAFAFCDPGRRPGSRPKIQTSRATREAPSRKAGRAAISRPAPRFPPLLLRLLRPLRPLLLPPLV